MGPLAITELALDPEESAVIYVSVTEANQPPVRVCIEVGRRSGNWLFHRASPLYEPGDQILPGNWGRLVLGGGPRHPLYWREYVLERVRQAEFLSKPSRMRACFAFEKVEAAERFSFGMPLPTPLPIYTYIVRIVGEGIATHRGDASWLEPDPIATYRTFEGVDACARHYWAGDERSPDNFETVVGGPLEIIQRVTPIQEKKVHKSNRLRWNPGDPSEVSKGIRPWLRDRVGPGPRGCRLNQREPHSSWSLVRVSPARLGRPFIFSKADL